MKKVIAIILILTVLLCLASCGSDGKSAKNNDMSSADTALNPATEVESNTENVPTHKNGNVLVAYFSVTHTTEGIAKQIADILGADLYEITPEEPYTDEDIDYNNDDSRTSVEMNDPDARPAIAGYVENMDQYDTVLIGYPIWWGDAPRIISTFMESYDFSGKTLIPFCTSGSSGITSSEANLKTFASDADWIDGKRFSGSDSREVIEKWINDLGLSE